MNNENNLVILMLNNKHFYVFLPLLFICFRGIGQPEDDFEKYKVISKRYLSKIEKNMNSISEHIEKKTIKALTRIQKQEGKLKDRLALKDTLAPKTLVDGNDTYEVFIGKIRNGVASKSLNECIPELDSLQTGLKFLEKTKSLEHKVSEELVGTITRVNNSIDGVKNRLDQADVIKSYVSERKLLLEVQFKKYGMAKELKKLEKGFYYYQRRLIEYKSLLKDRNKVETRAIAELRKLPAFTVFMKKNSQIEQLFRLPKSAAALQNLAGLQTRASVQSLISVQFASLGNGGQQRYIQQQMGQAQSELNNLNDKINKAVGGHGIMEMPSITPNDQRTKKFLKRTEYGFNFQSQKTNAFLPITTDIAVTAGYKLNDKSIIGIGLSYKVGWGDGWQHIRVTNEGIGLRSYLDLKLKGSLWFSGGYEQNYQKAFTKIDLLKDLNAWQTSGLIGVTKKYKIGKKTNQVQLLWDFLSYHQLPKRQPLLLRIGYIF
jgi:hypothetical protein